MDILQLAPFAQEVLLNAFRTHYQRFQNAVSYLVGSHTDVIVIERLGDDIDEFANMVAENQAIFPPEEFATLETKAVDASHHGRPVIVQTIRSGGPGRPRIHIDPDFLQWAYGQRPTAGIRVGRTTARNALLEYGIAKPQQSPFYQPDALSASANADPTNNDANKNVFPDVLDPDLPNPSGDFPAEVEELAASSQPTASFTGPMSDISDDDLDMLLLRLRTHYQQAGLSMLNGMLHQLGHRIAIERIRQSLLHIDPVWQIFECICIRRRDYCILGPNSLWHHDGQHGLICWGIECFKYHGAENLYVATWMENHCGTHRGSYIWGRSIHNVCIERLWIDVTAQVKVQYGLDINNVAHIWLLHLLFLGTINTQLTFFAESWNQHRIQIWNGANRCPTDMFVFDMYVNGVHGDQLPQEEEDLGEDKLEVYGIDWQGLCDNNILHSQAQSNSTTEGSSSWVGHTGTPPDLSQCNSFAHLIGSAEDGDIILLWSQALAHVHVLYPDVF
ncbi:hypothetical protein K438DRAFT_1836458 [Mycena galopus ATCC 62051]|nr:hypothetical protein K438DRAFT_1836458 [Mycena galopus ATCC 62051]